MEWKSFATIKVKDGVVVELLELFMGGDN